MQVLAASELQVDPVLAPDRSSLALQVRLLDDRGRSLPGRAVTLRLRVDDVAQAPVTLALGADGAATHGLPIARNQRVVEAQVSYEGDGATAAQERSIRVVLNVPYVTADVVVPPGGVELGGAPATFVVNLRVGAVVDFATQGVGVELREGDALLADNPAHAQILVRELVDAQGPGRDILLGEVVPLLDVLERFLRVEGLALLRPGLPVRAAILQVASAIILRSASGALQQPLWGPIDHARALARLLLFKEV